MCDAGAFVGAFRNLEGALARCLLMMDIVLANLISGTDAHTVLP